MDELVSILPEEELGITVSRKTEAIRLYSRSLGATGARIVLDGPRRHIEPGKEVLDRFMNVTAEFLSDGGKVKRDYAELRSIVVLIGHVANFLIRGCHFRNTGHQLLTP